MAEADGGARRAGAPARRDRGTVLVVDDDACTRQAYAALLEEYGYLVLQATNGGEAIRLVRERHPAVILMDILMPVIDGVEAAESLRAYPLTACVPIIAITGTTRIGERERMRRCCDELLDKPCPPDLLLARVDRLAARREDRVGG
jgi:CheY-like chemotaxis protein